MFHQVVSTKVQEWKDDLIRTDANELLIGWRGIQNDPSVNHHKNQCSPCKGQLQTTERFMTEAEGKKELDSAGSREDADDENSVLEEHDAAKDKSQRLHLQADEKSCITNMKPRIEPIPKSPWAPMRDSVGFVQQSEKGSQKSVQDDSSHTAMERSPMTSQILVAEEVRHTAKAGFMARRVTMTGNKEEDGHETGETEPKGSEMLSSSMVFPTREVASANRTHVASNNRRKTNKRGTRRKKKQFVSMSRRQLVQMAVQTGQFLAIKTDAYERSRKQKLGPPEVSKNLGDKAVNSSKSAERLFRETIDSEGAATTSSCMDKFQKMFYFEILVERRKKQGLLPESGPSFAERGGTRKRKPRKVRQHAEPTAYHSQTCNERVVDMFSSCSAEDLLDFEHETDGILPEDSAIQQCCESRCQHEWNEVLDDELIDGASELLASIYQ